MPVIQHPTGTPSRTSSRRHRQSARTERERMVRHNSVFFKRVACRFSGRDGRVVLGEGRLGAERQLIRGSGTPPLSRTRSSCRALRTPASSKASASPRRPPPCSPQPKPQPSPPPSNPGAIAPLCGGAASRLHELDARLTPYRVRDLKMLSRVSHFTLWRLSIN
jgi:hypothetical protein